MNLYGVIAFIVAIIVFAHVFHAVEPIQEFIYRITDIPVIDDYGDNPPLFKLAIRLAYLIVIIAILKLILSRESDE